MSTEKEVTLETATKSKKVYYKIDDGKWIEYKSKFIVNKNCQVYAKYISEDGMTSKTSSKYINSIKKLNKPYVDITYTPRDLAKEVEVTINSDANTVEYSYDGIIYNTYSKPFKVSKNCRIYAKATNNLGETIEYVNITNVGEKAPAKGKLDIGITVVPDNSEVVTNSAEVEIDYDKKADKKYYKIGSNDVWHEYTGKFTVNKNTTIYAYTLNENARGYEKKSISNLTTGISDPIISLNTYSLAPSVKASISYDKNAKIKKYRIGDGDLQDYTGTFELTENEIVYAYSKDILGNESESVYQVSNISSQPRYSVIDKDDYFILKLNYPLGVDDKEYKWQENGEWKKYDNQGILLIKEKAKDSLLGDKSKVEVKDESGKTLTFEDNYYIIDRPLSELIENIYMRWDYKVPDAPSIKLDKTTPTKKVMVSITYDKYSYKREYKLVTKDGKETAWKEYTGSFSIEDNETIVYARGKTAFDEVGKQSTLKVVNIDNEPPEIDFKSDLETPTRKLTLQLCGNDNLGIDYVGYIKGKKTSKEAIDDGVELSNYSTFDIDENGYYTIYARDKVGNVTSKIIKVENIDKNAPDIDINVLTSKYGTKAEIEIDYHDNNTKQYRIGSTGDYQEYKGKFTIKSEDVYTLANDDNTITIFARGKDKSGQIVEVSKKVYVLDLDIPTKPIINVSNAYPLLTEYGVENDNAIYIVYDNRDDIDNYYSIDDGKTWEKYTGPIDLQKGTIKAKSVKKESLLEVSSSKNISLPTDTLPKEVYDGDVNTSLPQNYGAYNYKLYVAEGMYNQKLNIISSTLDYMNYYTRVYAYDKNGNQLLVKECTRGNKTTDTITIPENTEYLLFSSDSSVNNHLYEISIETSPILNIESIYPSLTTYGVENGYNNVEINYFKTAEKKQYKIDDGDWQDYTGKIKLAIGEKLTARSIDKNNVKSNEAVYTSVLPTDALPKVVYDGDVNTSLSQSSSAYNYKLYVDEDMYNQKLNILSHTLNSNSYYTRVYAYDKDNTQLLVKECSKNSSVNVVTDTITIPENTKYLVFSSNNAVNNHLYEISIETSPTLNVEKIYPTLTAQGVKNGYNSVEISYFPTAVKKQYKVGTGDWQDYTGKVKLEIGEKITARSIDKNNTISTEKAYTSVLSTDALPKVVYDGDVTTTLPQSSNAVNYKINVDESMYNQKLNIVSYTLNSSKYYTRVYAYDKDNTQLLVKECTKGSKATDIMTIPENTKYLVFSSTNSVNNHLYEITPVISKTQSKANESKAITTDKKKEYVTPPSIEVSNSGIYTISKDVNISYSSGYTNEYSYDAKTWKKYTGTITLSENVTIYARSVKDDKVVASSSYKITKIDTESGDMSLNEIPSKITVGSEYSIPSSYSFNNLSGGEVKCYDNDKEVSNTKDLSVGSHNIICISSTKAGITIKITKNILVEEENKTVEENKIEESKGDDDNEKTPSESNTGTSTKEELETNTEETKE